MQNGEEGLLIAAAAPALLAEVLRRFGEIRLRVSGTSMLPAIRPGDILIVGRCTIDELGSGDVVLFRSGERLFAHRVARTCVGEGPSVLITKGDALMSDDPPLPFSQVLGRVTAICPGERLLRDRIRDSKIGSACGMAKHGCLAALGRLRRRR